MATKNLSPALRTPAPSRPHPKANHGYGKRSAPDQRPPRAEDFMLLPERERYIAGYLDHLPDGATLDPDHLPAAPAGPPAAGDVHARVGTLRDLMRAP